MDHLELLDTVQKTAAAALAEVERDDLTEPCPCEGWDVAMLLDKMVTSGALFAVLCRGERPGPELNLLFPTEIGRDDPTGAFSAAAADCLDAFRESLLEGEMMGPLGVMVPRRAGLMVRAMDCTLNTWDLATAIGGEHRIDDAIAAPLLDFAHGFLPKVRQKTDHVRFGEPQAGAGEDPLSQLVALSGRDPSWTP